MNKRSWIFKARARSDPSLEAGVRGDPQRISNLRVDPSELFGSRGHPSEVMQIDMNLRQIPLVVNLSYRQAQSALFRLTKSRSKKRWFLCLSKRVLSVFKRNHRREVCPDTKENDRDMAWKGWKSDEL